MIANILRFLRLRPIPKTPKAIATIAKKNASMLMIGSQELRFSLLFVSFVMFSFLIRVYYNTCEIVFIIVFIIDKIRADVNFYLNSSQGNFFLDIFSKNDKIVLMKT